MLTNRIGFLTFAACIVAAAGAAALTLEEARDLALAANPSLAAARARLRAARAGVDVARTLANPEASWDVEDFGASGVADVERQTTVTITQRLELFGKRAARVAAARNGGDAVAHDLAAARRDLLADVDRRFAALLGAQLRLEIADENRATATEVAAAVRALVEAGDASQIESARAESDLALAVVDRGAAERELAAAGRALGELWGDSAAPSVRAQGELVESVAVPDAGAGVAALAELPDLRRRDAEVARLEAQVRFARRQALPDVAVGGGERWYGDGGHGFVASVSLALPILTRFGPERAVAAAELEQARQERRAAELRLQSAFLETRAELARSVEEARALREDVLPRNRQVYAAIAEGYRLGKFRLLDLLEARRGLAAARLRHVEAVVRVNLGWADLRRLQPEDAGSADGGKP